MRLSIFAIAAVLPAAPVFADVSAEEVWEAWKNNLTVLGDDVLTVESEEKSGGILRVTGVEISYDDPSGAVNWSFGDLIFAEQADGTVAISLPSEIPLSFTAVEDGEEISFGMTVAHDGLAITASNATGPLVHEFTADAMTLDLTPPNDLEDDIEMDLTFGLSAVSGLVSAEGEEPRRQDFNMRADTLNYNVSVTEPEEGTFNMRMVSLDVTMGGTGTVPKLAEGADTTSLIADPDYEVSASFGTAGSDINIDFRGIDGEGAMNLTSGAGSLDFALGAGAISYDGGTADIAMSGQIPEVPLPISVSMARYDYDFAMPLVSSEEEQNFVLGMNLEGLEIDEFLWSLFDPGSILPRDPATVSLKLEGLGRWLVDIMDPVATAEIGDGEFPAEFSSAKISDLKVSLAGAELTGGGAFTFDNSDLFTFDGFPAPTGAIDLRLLGGNGLIDKLSQMGLLPQEQAMGARMMMGLFMTPGEGEDELTSKIEIQGTGEVFANGQRLR